VMTVPAPGGVLSPLVLAAAELVGIDEVYRVGGAQAVAALAFGTATIAPVDKIVGPGNAYVAAAKRRVFGQVGIDMIAGPSEILVVADRRNDPRWIAADLMSQAEHDSAAAVLIDRIAPEHLELALDEADALAERVSHAGAIFLGRHTPEAIGDYIAGPNHVLPTARTARFASGLGVLDFLKRSSLVRCDTASLAALAPAAIRLAEAEGLEAHALSLSIRLTRTA